VLQWPAGNHGSGIHQSKYPIQDDKYNNHDSLQANLIEGIDHWSLKRCLNLGKTQGLLYGNILYLPNRG